MFKLVVSLLAVMALALPSSAETFSLVLTDVPYYESIPIDFGQQFEDITDVALTVTSNQGPVYVCGEGYANACVDNVARFTLNFAASMSQSVLGEVDHQNWNEWVTYGSNPVPYTDWSILNSGTAELFIYAGSLTCFPNWQYGEGYCFPEGEQFDEIVITVTTGVVASEASPWGMIKSVYR